MIVIGDISGIQRYVFDVPEFGGGQARRLRARSFLVQALSEFAALRILRDFGWPIGPSHCLFVGAGKLILRGTGNLSRVPVLADELNYQLLTVSSGELRLSIGVAAGGSEVDEYHAAQADLNRMKTSPFRTSTGWHPERLVLAALDTPCVLCRRGKGAIDEKDPNTGVIRLVCDRCATNFYLGRRLPRARAMAVQDGEGDFEWFGLHGVLQEDLSSCKDSFAVIAFDGRPEAPPSCPHERYLSRRLMTTIPIDGNGDPVWFMDLAERSTGDQLLAVLKADVDSLGVEIEKQLAGQNDLTSFLRFADSLDRFFAEELHYEVRKSWSNLIYTVFAGGDDLVMIGPWNTILDFAERVRVLFQQRFPNLTLSAGVSLFKVKRPVKSAIEEADRLLDQAKQGPKNQCAALGEVWPWDQHAMILREAKQLAGWVKDGALQRGWLHTLLELAESRHGRSPNTLATARLAYHVARNYRDRMVRAWADRLVRTFDNSNDPVVRFMPAILRYALTATRKAGEKE